jgi:hypothetical protein
VIDTDGVEWLLVTEAATRLHSEPTTIRSWINRGKVAAYLVRGRTWVRMPDVMNAEHATRGAYVALRARNCNNAASSTDVPEAG